jgi:hypothetical protein
MADSAGLLSIKFTNMVCERPVIGCRRLYSNFNTKLYFLIIFTSTVLMQDFSDSLSLARMALDVYMCVQEV